MPYRFFPCASAWLRAATCLRRRRIISLLCSARRAKAKTHVWYGTCFWTVGSSNVRVAWMRPTTRNYYSKQFFEKWRSHSSMLPNMKIRRSSDQRISPHFFFFSYSPFTCTRRRAMLLVLTAFIRAPLLSRSPLRAPDTVLCRRAPGVRARRQP